MSFFDWLSKLLGGRPPQPQRPAAPRPAAPAGQQPAARAPAAAAGPAPRPAAPAPRPAPKETKLDLALDRYAPLSDADMKQAAGKLGGRWSNAWWGRRDLIPSDDDARTLLIDNGMVGAGFITAEELAEIHDVGHRMDEVRPDRWIGAAVAEAAALTADKAARDEVKRRKKAQAEERRKRHAAGVAQRKATDIDFLGRGVSQGLADRRADVEKLTAAGLPVLATPADVATALGLTIPRLRWLAFHQEAATRTHYVRFEVPKKSGGVRVLAAPHRSLRGAQEWVLRRVLDKVPLHAAAHGFVKTRSTLTNAAGHVGQDVVVNLDLSDFFPSITFPRVRGAFRQLGYSPAAATVMALLCTESPRREATLDGETYQVATGERALPQGACTSPALSNLIARRLDARLAGLAAKLGFAYSRYADDLTFSAKGDAARHAGRIVGAVRRIAAAEGFAVNEKKTRTQPRSTSQRVTGLVVNDRPGVPRRTVRRLRSILHHARREGLAAQNRENRPEYAAWLRGMIAYVEMADPGKGARLREEFERLAV